MTNIVDLKKPTDLDLHCLQRQGISVFNRLGLRFTNIIVIIAFGFLNVRIFSLQNVKKETTTQEFTSIEQVPADKEFKYGKWLSDISKNSKSSGPSCSKLTTSLVKDSLKFTSSDMQIC